MKSPSPNKDYIATFHTHFGALTFHRKLMALGDVAVMMPVPRKLSASCGTCVKFFLPFDPEWADENLEAVYAKCDACYESIFENAEN